MSRVPGGCHLTYCSNIHPGETWPEVRANLERHVTAVKAGFGGDGDFGVGLRLSNESAVALGDPATLAGLKDFLTSEGLYVFTINGFPYGRFHGAPVKEQVYLPDWRDEARLAYTNLLADILAELLPDEPGLEGSVSTVPVGFRPEIATADDVARAVGCLLDHAAHLVELARRSGRTIALAVEPEPCCHLETVAETVDFFQTHLFSPGACRQLAERTGLGPTEAEAALRRHLGVCLDLCHAAVEFEDPEACVADLRAAGIKIAKLQVTAGLRVPRASPEAAALLRPFDDAVYLHQVVASDGGRLERFVDLAPAFDSLDDRAPEWRVHFHVPVFLEDLGQLATTQDFIRRILALHRDEPVSRHIEVETYTWDVLPEAHRTVDVDTAVVRELDWTRAQLNA